MSDFTISLQPKQKIAFEESQKFPYSLYGGAKGGGKSYLVRERELYRRYKYRGTTGLIIRKTYGELLDTHINPMLKEHSILRSWYKDGEKAIYYPWGSVTKFAYLSRTADVYTYRGRPIEDVSIDEATEHQEEVFDEFSSIVRTTNSEIKPTIFLTANPGGIGHQWVMRKFVDRSFNTREDPDDYTFVQANVYDNKKLTEANPEYLKKLEALPPVLRSMYLLGDWHQFAGQAFIVPDECIATTTIKEPNIKWAGFDWGYNHPYVFVLAVKGLNNVINIPVTSSGRKMKPFDVGKAIRELLTSKSINRLPIFCGEDIFRSDGRIPIYTELKAGLGESAFLVKATTNRIQGAQAIRSKFVDRKVVIDPRETELIATIRRMLIDPKNTESVLKIDADSDGKGGDDYYDAFRYCIMGETNVENAVAWEPEINTGDYLLKRIEQRADLQDSIDPFDY